MPTHQRQSNHQQRAVQTFECDVSAGQPLHVQESPAGKLVSSYRRLATKILRQDLPAQHDEHYLDDETGQYIPVAAEIAPSTNPDLEVPLIPALRDTPRRKKRHSLWWITSFGLHGLLLIGLGFSTLAVMQEETLELQVRPIVSAPLEEFDDVPIEPEPEPELLDDELHDLDTDVLSELEDQSLFEEPLLGESTREEATLTGVPGELSELDTLFGEHGAGLTGLGEELGQGTEPGASGGMAKFFGTEIKAKRILYMLDNSGGMRKGGKFEALVSELLASVEALQSKQKFYVIFYSDTVYPLFYPRSVRKFVPATAHNRKQLQRWLETVELCTGNAIDEALAAAEVIQPDAVFLLTDGDLFTTEKKKALLLNPLRRNYPIHTFGLGVSEQTKTAAGLQQVAAANRGTSRLLQVPDATKNLAAEKQRPYHNKQPGAIWGLKVGVR